MLRIFFVGNFRVCAINRAGRVNVNTTIFSGLVDHSCVAIVLSMLGLVEILFASNFYHRRFFCSSRIMHIYMYVIYVQMGILSY